MAKVLFYFPYLVMPFEKVSMKMVVFCFVFSLFFKAAYLAAWQFSKGEDRRDLSMSESKSKEKQIEECTPCQDMKPQPISCTK